MCAGAFGANFFMNGGLRSIGILIVDVMETYNSDPATAALIVAFMAGSFALFGNLLLYLIIYLFIYLFTFFIFYFIFIFF